MKQSDCAQGSAQMASDPVLRKWIPDGAVWERLTGGRTNLLWRVNSGDDVLVVKLFVESAATPMFPNDPDAEVAALRCLDTTGLAPRLIGDVETRQGRCVIYRHVEGTQPMVTPTGMAHALASLHRIPPIKGMRQPPSGSRAVLGQGYRILAMCRNSGRLATFRPTVAVEPVRQTVFLHGDPVPANAVPTDTGVCLIDWQCPAQGDPAEDLAVFLSPAMQLLYGAGPLSRIEVESFLAAYGDATVTDRYRSLASAFHWRMAAYCQWRSEQSGSDGRDSEALELEITALKDAF